MFDFTSVFEKIKLLYTNGLRNRMLRQESLDGSGYSRPELSTLKARQRTLAGTKTKVGKTLRGSERRVKAVGSHAGALSGVPITRMVVSRDTALSAFQGTAAKDGLTIFVSDRKHRYNDMTYLELIRYNSRGTGDTNPNVKSPPLIFPNTAEEVELMRSETNTAWNLFVQEASRQAEKNFRLRLSVELSM